MLSLGGPEEVNIADSRREFERRHKELGLCVKCSNLAIPNEKLCAKCNRKHKLAIRKFTLKHIRLGLCEKCSKPAIPNHIYCVDCNEKHKIVSQKIRENYKANNRCRCGAPLVDEYKNCPNCRSKLYRTRILCNF